MPDDTCIFCRIARGEIPCAKIYEDDKVLAFLDMGPVRPGHALVIPKEHYANLPETPDELAPAIFKACKLVGKALMNTVGATGYNVMQNNFSSSGQMVFHVHWHIIPREEQDGIKHWDQGTYADMAAMQSLAGKISASVEH